MSKSSALAGSVFFNIASAACPKNMSMSIYPAYVFNFTSVMFEKGFLFFLDTRSTLVSLLLRSCLGRA